MAELQSIAESEFSDGVVSYTLEGGPVYAGTAKEFQDEVRQECTIGGQKLNINFHRSSVGSKLLGVKPEPGTKVQILRKGEGGQKEWKDIVPDDTFGEIRFTRKDNLNSNLDKEAPRIIPRSSEPWSPQRESLVNNVVIRLTNKDNQSVTVQIQTVVKPLKDERWRLKLATREISEPQEENPLL